MNFATKYFSSVKKKYKIKNHIAYFIFVAVIITLAPLGFSGVLQRSTEYLLEQIGYSIIMATSLSLVVGFLGELSLGHAGFISIGAMFGALFQNSVYPDFSKQAPLLALIVTMIIGGLIAGVFGFIIGLPALRLKGDYLAIVTLAFCLIVQTLFEQIPRFGGASGITNSFRYDRNKLFVIIFVVALLSLVLINNFIRSKHGRAVTAIRDNEIASRAMGVNVTFYKLTVFVFSSFLAGVAGVLFAATKGSVQPNAFTYNLSIDILIMVVLGGMGSINGSVIAAALITFLNVKLDGIFSGNLAALKNIIYALILIFIVIYTNAPRFKTFRAKYNLRNFYFFLKKKIYKLFTKKVKKENPATEVDFGADWSKVPTKIEMDAILSTDISPDKACAEPNDGRPEGE